MKIKTNELTGAALDWAVMKAEGLEPTIEPDGYLHVGNVRWQPSRNWCDGGPIIEREWISIECWPNESDEDMRWAGACYEQRNLCEKYGPTPLIAAMRCYVASKLGDEVEVPEELA